MNPTETHPTLPRLWLQEEFQRRRARNPAYSLRAFAKALEVPPGRLSEIIANKRRLSPRLGAHVAEKLGLSPETRARFLDCISRERDPNASGAASTEDHLQLSMDAFHAIRDPHHFSILSLMEIEGFRDDARWIGQRLGISAIEARSAIERLERLGLIGRSAESPGQLVLTTGKLTTTHDVSSAALRESHRQTLQQAIDTLESVPVELRDITSMTLAIDVRRLPEAKLMIKEFRRRLGAFLEDGRKTQVYNLNIQLIPVSRSTGPEVAAQEEVIE